MGFYANLVRKLDETRAKVVFKLAVAFLHPLTGHQHADCAAPEKQANQKHRPGWTNMVMCAIFMSAVFHDLTAIQCSDDKELRRWDNSAVNEDSMSSCPCRYVGVIVAVLSLLKLLSRYSFFTFWVFELSVLIGFLKNFLRKVASTIDHRLINSLLTGSLTSSYENFRINRTESEPFLRMWFTK